MTDTSNNITNTSAALHGDASNYPKGGSAGIKGGIYQVKLLMLFLHRSLTNQYSFRLATELKTAGKFDDLVIEYILDDKKEHRFLQAKHKEDKTKCITIDDMFCENDGDFSLLKYFKSYREIKGNPEFRNSLKDVIIFTNIGFKSDDIAAALEKIGNVDDILDFQLEIEKHPALYRFKDNFDSKEKLFKVLRKGSSLYTLAQKLAECVCYDKPIQSHQKDSVFHLYRNLLAKDVIDYRKKIFKENFLNPLSGEYSDDIKDFREFFLEGIQFSVKTHSELTGKASEKKKIIFDFNCEDNILQQIKEKQIILKLDKKFGKTTEERNVPLDEVFNSEIQEFLKKLVFAVNQPNEDELEIIIKSEFRKEFNNIDAENVYSRFFVKILNWMKLKEGKFFTHDEGKDYFNILKEEILGSVRFDIRDPVCLFTGRKEELTKLHNTIQRSPKVAVVSQMTSISGLGGIGKSELARKYVSVYEEQYDGNVMWINAETNETLEESFNRLARDNKLGIPLKDKYGEKKELTSVVKEIYEFFGKRKSLFIFDNAENNKVLHKFLRLLSFLPQNNRPYVLVTSREKEWEDGIEIIELNVWSREEAIEFVKKGLNLIFDELTENENIVSLVTILQCFPLALQQAISYIIDQQVNDEFGIKDYLNLYENKKKDLLDSEIFRGIDNDYSKTIFTTWKITVKKIGCDRENGELAIQLLNTIAYFSPLNIHREFLLGLGNNEDEGKLKSAVRLLVKYSMLENENKQKILNIHRLVQEAIRLELKDQGKEEEILRNALALLNKYWEKHFKSGNRCLLNENIDHSVSVWKYASECSSDLMLEFCVIPSHIIEAMTNNVRYKEAHAVGSEALMKLQSVKQTTTNMNIFDGILQLKINIGKVCLKQGDYIKSLNFYTEAYRFQKSKFGENDENSLVIKKNIADVYVKQCHYKDAVRIYKEVLQLEKTIFPENHDCILLTKIDLGNAFINSGNYKEGLGILEDVVKAVKDNEQRNHPLIYRARSSLASGFYCCGKYDEAMQLLDDAEELERLIYANDHPDTLSTKKVRASIQFKKGKYKESLVMYESILKIEKETFSEDILTILSSKYCSGWIHVEQGNYDEGLKILKETLDGRQHILGEDDNSTWEIMQSIADVYCEQGSYDEALEIYERVLKNREHKFGTKHFETLSTSSNMAYCSLKKGLPKTYFNNFKDVLVMTKQVFGENHPETLATKTSMGLNLLELGKYDEALEMFQEVFRVQTDSFGEEHPYSLKALNNIGLIREKQKKYEDALRCFDTVLCKQIKTLGESHPDSVNTKVNKAEILLSLKKFDEALIILYSVCNIKETNLPETHPAVLRAKGTIAQVHIQRNKPKLALEILDKLLKIQIKNNHFQDILKIKHAIAGAMSLLGKHAESLELYQEVYVAKSETLAEDNPEIILTKFCIGIQNLNLGNFRKGLKILLEVLEMQTKILLPDNADIANSRQEISKWLLAEGKQWTVLHLASSCSNDPEFIQKLLQEGFDINAVTRDGFQPLHLAAEYNNYETCQALIKYFKDKYANKLSGFINGRIDDSKRTTLHIAAENDNMEIVVMLLQNGADYSVRDKQGMSPLFWSISGSRVSFLLKCTEDLFVAVENGEKNVAVSILDNLNSNFSKAVLNARNNRNRTAIQMSVTHNQRDLAQILVSKLDS